MTAARTGVPRAWRRLAAHSERLGAEWVRRGLAGGGWAHPRAGLYRMLVPLEPWRFYELARVAAEPFHGDCLDVSSPKLLASTLAREGRGAGWRWTCSPTRSTGGGTSTRHSTCGWRTPAR